MDKTIFLSPTQDLNGRKHLLYYSLHGFPCTIFFQPFVVGQEFFLENAQPLFPPKKNQVAEVDPSKSRRKNVDPLFLLICHQKMFLMLS